MVPFAAVALWLAPRRLGPRIAASAWTKGVFVWSMANLAALSIAVFGLLPDVGSLRSRSGNIELWPREGQAPLKGSERIRYPLAVVCTLVFAATEFPGNSNRALASLAGVLGATLLVPLLFPPILAAGERTREAYRRGLKFLLWTWPGWIVPVCATLLRERADPWTGMPQPSVLGSWTEAIVTLVVSLWGLIWLGRIAQLNWRFCESPRGAAGGSRPLCRRCGYDLSGLPAEGRCPECGADLRPSLPEYRQPPPSGQSGRPFRCATVRTAYAVCRHGEFFERLSVHRARFEACRFAVRIAAGAGLLACVAALILITANELRFVDAQGFRMLDPDSLPRLVAQLAMVWACATYAVLAALLLVAWIATRFGWRDPRKAGTTLCYGAALLWPVMAAFDAWLALSTLLSNTWLYGGIGELKLTEGYTLDYATTLLAGLFIVLVGPVLAWALLRAREALCAVRYAHA